MGAMGEFGDEWPFPRPVPLLCRLFGHRWKSSYIGEVIRRQQKEIRDATPPEFRDVLISIARSVPGYSLGSEPQKPGYSLGIAIP